MHILTSQLRHGETYSSQALRSPAVVHLPEYRTRRRYILLAGVLMPFTVLMAVPAVVDKWERETKGGLTRDIRKPTAVTTLMAISLVLAVMSNVALYARLLLYRPRLMTLITTVASGFRVLLSTAALVAHRFMIPNVEQDSIISYTSEWIMCIADTALSGFVFGILVYDVYHARRYDLKGSGLSHKERLFINTIVATVLWWALGSMVFMYLENWPYLSSLFFGLVTMSTVGFGNLAPTSVGSKIVCIIFAFMGVALLGMLINSFATMVLDNIRRETETRITEMRRRRYERRQRAVMRELDPVNDTDPISHPLETAPTDYTDVYGSVDDARREKDDIQGSEIVRKLYFSLSSLIICIVIHTFIFAHTENWAYMDSFYFCSITIMTIGFGDFVPTSHIGEVMFILFCITGLACMTYCGLVISQMRRDYVTYHILRVEKILRRYATLNEKNSAQVRMTETNSSVSVRGTVQRSNPSQTELDVEAAATEATATSKTAEREQAMNEVLEAARQMRRTLKAMTRASVNIPKFSSDISNSRSNNSSSNSNDSNNSHYNINNKGSMSAVSIPLYSFANTIRKVSSEHIIIEESNDDVNSADISTTLSQQVTPLGRLAVWHNCHDYMERIILATERLLEIEHLDKMTHGSSR
ncbi:hypothetical protein BDF19DRAFT_425871 [Syncephalis fuscata]|nr:hypothetical protein BDF19DRAFT_425871 [Syncephalis fuscata]